MDDVRQSWHRPRVEGWRRVLMQENRMKRRREYDRARYEARKAYMKAWYAKGSRGKRGAKPQISDRAIRLMREAYADGQKVQFLAKAYGMSYSYVYKICRRKERA